MRVAGSLLLLFTLAVFSAAQSTDTNFPVGPQYLVTTNQTLFLHPIATPSLSLQPPSPPPLAMETNPGTDVELASPPPAIETRPDLSRILWGDEAVDRMSGFTRPTTVIEIHGTSNPKLPASLFDPGVTALTDSQSLRSAGYGITPGEASSMAKSRPRATRVFTNEDVKRLHGG